MSTQSQKKGRAILLANLLVALLLCAVCYTLFAPWASSSLSQLESDYYDVNKDEVSFDVNGVNFKMILVQGGKFALGVHKSHLQYGYPDEKPSHAVTVSTFRIGETEVTQALWEAVMGSNPSGYEDPDCPVENVSYYDVQTFIVELNKMTGLTFRLPTEAEWEYAARGGANASSHLYSGDNWLDKVGWYDENSGGHPHRVKSLSPNEERIYDMSGNVWEWVSDWYGPYSEEDQVNPDGVVSGSRKVIRGGAYNSKKRNCRVANRSQCALNYKADMLGFRLVLESDFNMKRFDPLSVQFSTSVVDSNEYTHFDIDGVGFSVVHIEGGTFQMGATKELHGPYDQYSMPVHSVTVSGFNMSLTEVTQELWELVMDFNPSFYKGAQHPVEQVNFDDVQSFLSRLNRITGRKFRLPTEAEWEYAARGGQLARKCKYSGSNNLDEVAWHAGNCDGHTQPVGLKKPNELGLYDMSGNVWEWCSDYMSDYTAESQLDPSGFVTGGDHSARGGSWYNDEWFIFYPNMRAYASPDSRELFLGFRLVLED